MADHAPIDAVMFDVDGTLLDSRGAIEASYEEASAEVLGRPFTEDHATREQVLKLRAAEAFPIVVGEDTDKLDAFSTAFQAAYAVNQANVPPFDGLVAALEQLAELGVGLGIATSKARSRLDLDLDRSGIRSFFDPAAVVSGDEVPHAKPAPDPVLAVLAALGADPDRALYVGDGENDVLASHAAGVRAVGVSFGFHPDDCRAAGPEYMVDSYAELVEIVAASRAAAAQS